MSIKLFTTVLGITGLFHLSLNAQDGYNHFISEAESLFASEHYQEAANKYKEAFRINNGRAFTKDRYKAACAMAISGEPDEAFFHLFYIAKNQFILYEDYEEISGDRLLKPLHALDQWQTLIELVKRNKEEYGKQYDHDLITLLDSIHHLDQLYRNQLDSVIQYFGRASKEFNHLATKMHETDSLNTKFITQLLDNRGWLGPKVVGNQGSTTIWLVIQHSEKAIQEKYLPMMRTAFEKGEALGSQLALLEDRVRMRNGEKQIYGSQILTDDESGELYVYPLIDPEKVNERRASAGMESIEQYLSYFGLEWDVEKHLERINKMDGG